MKVLVGENDDRIVGFTMIGSEAGEVMAIIQTAMLAGLPYSTLRDAVFSHLTIAEGLGPLFSNVPDRGLTRGEVGASPLRCSSASQRRTISTMLFRTLLY